MQRSTPGYDDQFTIYGGTGLYEIIAEAHFFPGEQIPASWTHGNSNNSWDLPSSPNGAPAPYWNNENRSNPVNRRVLCHGRHE